MKGKYWKMQGVGRGVQGQCYSSEKTRMDHFNGIQNKIPRKRKKKLPNIHLKCCFLRFFSIVLEVLC